VTHPGEQNGLERDVARLAQERTALFCRSGRSAGLSSSEQARLRVIERELDEAFDALRRARAARNVVRFGREDPIVRRAAAARERISAAGRP
jgi:hypothetical protein